MIDNTVAPMKVESPVGYTGSQVHTRVKSYLDSLVKEDLSVAQMLTTKHKQVQAKEIQFAVLGKGQIIGEVDAATGRNCIYSLRSKTFNAKLYLIERKEFMNLVNQYDKNHFKRACLIAQKQLANKLANSIQNYHSNFKQISLVSKM